MLYEDLVETYQQIESTSKRLEKTNIIANLLKKTETKDLKHILLLIRGNVFPQWDERKIGVAAKLVLKSINVASGIDVNKIEEEWKNTGDLGIVAGNLIEKKKQATLFESSLNVEKVFSNIEKLATLEGQGSVDKKVGLIAELLTSAKPNEAKYVIRTVLEELRIGVGDGSIRDAIAWAYLYDVTYDKGKNDISLNDEEREKYNAIISTVQSAYDKSNDFYVVAKAAKIGIEALKSINLLPGNPVKVMLAQKVNDVKDGFERVGIPCAIEFKYDGFRMQIHKSEEGIKIFTRRLEDITKQFPRVVNYVEESITGESFILDAESVGFDPKTGKYLAFQNISQRIKRKYNIEEMADKFPVEVNIFDVILYNGESMIDSPFKERRKLLEKITSQNKKKIVLARQIIVSEQKEANSFYEESLQAGNEGVMLKKMDAPYKPGSRVGYMVKLKPIMETLDLVIVGAEWGEGKRANWLTSFKLACIDENGDFLDIGKVGTGIKELEEEGVTFNQITEILKPLIIWEKGREIKVKPELVIEINYEEIQKSPTYSSGYALRFPRLVNLREDRAPEEASTIDTVEELFFGQK